MSSERPDTVELADRVSAICYAIAGWLTVLLGLGIALVAISGFAASEPNLGTALLATVLFAVGFVVTSLGVFVNPGMRRRLDRRHAPTEFGRVQSVDQRVIRPEENCLERCTSCDSRVEKGLVRRYREELALAGLPIYTASEGYNYYCLACAKTEVFGEPDASADGADARRGRRSVDDRLLERR